jgi:hypothetical protein
MARRKQAPVGLPLQPYADLASAAEQLLDALRRYETMGASRGYARCMSLDRQLIAIRQPFLAAEDALHALGFSYRLYDRPQGKDGTVLPLDEALKRGIDILREVLYDIRGGGINPTPDPQDDRYARPQEIPARMRMETAARPVFASEASRLSEAVELLRRAIPLGVPHPQRRRRRQASKKISPLTPQQVEAMQLVAEHKGDVSAAARFAGKSRQAMKKLYDKATAKMGLKATPKPKTQKLPEDQRGQANIPDPLGPRRRRKYEEDE